MPETMKTFTARRYRSVRLIIAVMTFFCFLQVMEGGDSPFKKNQYHLSV